VTKDIGLRAMQNAYKRVEKLRKKAEKGLASEKEHKYLADWDKKEEEARIKKLEDERYRNTPLFTREGEEILAWDNDGAVTYAGENHVGRYRETYDATPSGLRLECNSLKLLFTRDGEEIIDFKAEGRLSGYVKVATSPKQHYLYNEWNVRGVKI